MINNNKRKSIELKSSLRQTQLSNVCNFADLDEIGTKCGWKLLWIER